MVPLYRNNSLPRYVCHLADDIRGEGSWRAEQKNIGVSRNSAWSWRERSAARMGALPWFRWLKSGSDWLTSKKRQYLQPSSSNNRFSPRTMKRNKLPLRRAA
jgi:hypothetical protein